MFNSSLENTLSEESFLHINPIPSYCIYTAVSQKNTPFHYASIINNHLNKSLTTTRL